MINVCGVGQNYYYFSERHIAPNSDNLLYEMCNYIKKFARNNVKYILL